MSENTIVKKTKDKTLLCTSFVNYISKKQYKRANDLLNNNPELLPNLGYGTIFSYLRILGDIPKKNHSENYLSLYKKLHSYLDSKATSLSRAHDQQDKNNLEDRL